MDREWGDPTLRELKLLSQEEREEMLEYLQEMGLYAEVEAGGKSFVLVHAGLDNFAPDKPLGEYNLGTFCLPDQGQTRSIIRRKRLFLDTLPPNFWADRTESFHRGQ